MAVDDISAAYAQPAESVDVTHVQSEIDRLIIAMRSDPALADAYVGGVLNQDRLTAYVYGSIERFQSRADEIAPSLSIAIEPSLFSLSQYHSIAKNLDTRLSPPARGAIVGLLPGETYRSLRVVYDSEVPMTDVETLEREVSLITGNIPFHLLAAENRRRWIHY